MRPKIFLFIPLIFVLAAALVMILWNHVIVDIAPVSKIHFFQAAGILILCRILFGRLPYGGGRGRSFGPPPHVKSKWMNMSNEEREKFKEEWRRRCRK